MNAVYANQSYFHLTLSGIPPGFDLTNGTYPGWCVQKNMDMTQHVNHTVLLYDSTSENLPSDYQMIHWEYINYLLNNRVGNRTSMQHAIWYFTDEFDCSTDPDAYAMIIDAELHGEAYQPSLGELIAVPIIGVPTIQFTFLETLLPPLHDLQGLVWNDLNKNGLQDPSEPGKNDISVYLSHSDNILINTSKTTTMGTYHFSSVPSGSYYLTFVLPTNYQFSPQDVGTNDAIDSDVDMDGRTPVFLITPGQPTHDWDAGIYTPMHRPVSTPNHKPTADGTAGEPYTGFINQPILFNGSRSYDRDGNIISYLWSYGDGSLQTGAVTAHTYTKTGVYSVSLTVTDDDYASDTYTTTAQIITGNNPPNRPALIGPTFGHAHILYDYLLVATDTDNDTIRYIIIWDDNHTDTSPFFKSGHPITVTHQWTTYGFYTIQAYVQDRNNATSAIMQLPLAIDVHYVGPYGYLIDTDSDGIYNTFHSNSTQLKNSVKYLPNGDYLIDIDNDGTWDIIYHSTTNQYQTYNELPIVQYLLLVLLIIAIILLAYLLKIKRQTRILISNRKNKP